LGVGGSSFRGTLAETEKRGDQKGGHSYVMQSGAKVCYNWSLEDTHRISPSKVSESRGSISMRRNKIIWEKRRGGITNSGGLICFENWMG